MGSPSVSSAARRMMKTPSGRKRPRSAAIHGIETTSATESDPEPQRIERQAARDAPPCPPRRRNRQAERERHAERGNRVDDSRVEVVLVDDARPRDDRRERDRRRRERPRGAGERVDRHEDDDDRDERHREVQLDEDARQASGEAVPGDVIEVVGRGSRIRREPPVRHEDHPEHDRPHRPGGEGLALRRAEILRIRRPSPAGGTTSGCSRMEATVRTPERLTDGSNPELTRGPSGADREPAPLTGSLTASDRASRGSARPMRASTSRTPPSTR